MHSLVNILTLLSALAVCVRLLTYRPPADARQRYGVGFCAWLLIAGTGGQALHILLAGSSAHVNPWNLGVLLALVVLTYRTRGNVARLMRLN